MLADSLAAPWSVLSPEFRAAYAQDPGFFVVLAALLTLALVGFIGCLGCKAAGLLPRRTGELPGRGRRHPPPGRASLPVPALSSSHRHSGSAAASPRPGRKHRLHATRSFGIAPPVTSFSTDLAQRYVSVLVKAVLLGPPGRDRDAGR
jgi:hypothetical protein